MNSCAFLPPIWGVFGWRGRKTIVFLEVGSVVDTARLSARSAAPEALVVRRRRPLPGGRAAAGALLIAVAAVGTFAAASGATRDARRQYLVARADLAVGHRIARSDLAVARMDLPAYLARGHAFGRAGAGRLVGALVIGPVARGELVQRSSVRLGGAAAGGREVSFAIDPARAVGGSLQPGEFVDVLATYGGSSDGYTVTVVRAARVVGARDRGGLSGGDSLVLTLDLPSADAALAVAHAVDSGHVTVVRSGPRTADERATPPYKAPAAG
jgi:Flp pilus assembly protein CpaB